ncbi:class D sortase [Halobacillus sp. GSS1]|nr:class D sortase [Halobacillus sp. GSS1]
MLLYFTRIMLVCSFPGETGHTACSGHRDTVFRRLGEVGVGDRLTVKSEAGVFTYKVRKVRIFDQDDHTIIVPRPKATLIVSTCNPFDFICPAPERYILIADLIVDERKKREKSPLYP